MVAVASRTRFTVTGPETDRGYPAGGIALSAAISYATQATTEATFYVRDASGDLFGRVDRAEDGSLTVVRMGRER